QGRTADAITLYERSIEIATATLGADDAAVSNGHNSLALMHLAQSDWAQATDHWRRSTWSIIRRSRRGMQEAPAAMETRTSISSQWGFNFASLVKASYRQAAALQDSAPLSDESFQAAQWAQGSAAATALAQMVARSATSDGDLGRLVRERQDLVGEWGVLDRARVTAVAEVPAKRDRATEATMAARLA